MKFNRTVRGKVVKVAHADVEMKRQCYLYIDDDQQITVVRMNTTFIKNYMEKLNQVINHQDVIVDYDSDYNVIRIDLL